MKDSKMKLKYCRKKIYLNSLKTNKWPWFKPKFKKCKFGTMRKMNNAEIRREMVEV